MQSQTSKFYFSNSTVKLLNLRMLKIIVVVNGNSEESPVSKAGLQSTVLI